MINRTSKISRILGALSGAMLLLVTITSPAVADGGPTSVEDFNATAEAALLKDLTAAARESGLLVEFGDVEISASKQLVTDYAGDAEAYASDIVSTYEADTTVQKNVPPHGTITPLGTSNYTSSVFAGVPAGGVCWIKQDFRATVTNYRVTSKTLRGSSYQTGVCVFSWSANYSYFSGSLNLYSRGTFSAVIKGGPVKFSATFMAIYKVNKSSLTQNVQ